MTKLVAFAPALLVVSWIGTLGSDPAGKVYAGQSRSVSESRTRSPVIRQPARRYGTSRSAPFAMGFTGRAGTDRIWPGWV